MSFRSRNRPLAVALATFLVLATVGLVCHGLLAPETNSVAEQGWTRRQCIEIAQQEFAGKRFAESLNWFDLVFTRDEEDPPLEITPQILSGERLALANLYWQNHLPEKALLLFTRPRSTARHVDEDLRSYRQRMRLLERDRALFLSTHGDEKKARQIFEKLLTETARERGALDLECYRLRKDLAGCLLWVDRTAALKLYSDLVEQYAASPEKRANALAHAAEFYYCNDMLAEAAQFAGESLRIRERLYGAESLVTRLSKKNLLQALRAVGKSDEANRLILDDRSLLCDLETNAYSDCPPGGMDAALMNCLLQMGPPRAWSDNSSDNRDLARWTARMVGYSIKCRRFELARYALDHASVDMTPEKIYLCIVERNFGEAERLSLAYLNNAAKRNDTFGVAEAYNWLAFSAYKQGRIRRAIEILERGLRQGNLGRAADCVKGNLVLLYSCAGRFVESRKTLSGLDCEDSNSSLQPAPQFRAGDQFLHQREQRYIGADGTAMVDGIFSDWRFKTGAKKLKYSDLGLPLASGDVWSRERCTATPFVDFVISPEVLSAWSCEERNTLVELALMQICELEGDRKLRQSHEREVLRLVHEPKQVSQLEQQHCCQILEHVSDSVAVQQLRHQFISAREKGSI